MAKYDTKECPRCGEQVYLWFNRKVCASCRVAETRTPEHKAKANVWSLVNRAKRDGRLTRQPCEVCGAAKSEAHHDDYSQPLSVRWLCRSHHKIHHHKFGPGLNTFVTPSIVLALACLTVLSPVIAILSLVVYPPFGW